MERTTKISCEGAIYTVLSDAYETASGVDMDAGVAAEDPHATDEVIEEERARYAQILKELTEFEDTITQAEEQFFLTERLDAPEDVGGGLDQF